MHLTISIPLILVVVSLIKVTRCPSKFTLAMLLIILICAHILIGVYIVFILAPNSLAMLESILELTFILTPI